MSVWLGFSLIILVLALFASCFWLWDHYARKRFIATLTPEQLNELRRYELGKRDWSNYRNVLRNQQAR